MAQLLVELVGALLALDGHEAGDAFAHTLLCLVELGSRCLGSFHLDLIAQIVLHGVGKHKIAVGQTLHQSRCAQTVCTVVREVAFADGEKTLDRGLQLVVYPDAAHGVVRGGENHHGSLIGIVVGNHLVHVEEVAVAVGNHILAQTVDGIFEIEIHGIAGAHAVACVAALLGGTRCDVAGAEVTESGVAALQIEVAVLVGDVGGFLFAGADGLGILFLLGHPDAAVVTERFAHEGELRLILAMDGDTGGVNLGECEVGQVGAFAECLDGSRAVAAHSVGREEECTAVTAGGEHHGMGRVALEFAGDEVAHDHTACTAVDDDDVEHLAAYIALHGALFNLAVERRVGAEQQLLAGLAFGVECAGYLGAAKRAVGQQTAVFTGEGHTLCHALVDDVRRHFGQTVNVGLA